MKNNKTALPEGFWPFDESTVAVDRNTSKVKFILQCVASGRVLDLGCNDGGIAHEIRRRGAHVIGADTYAYATMASRKYRLPVLAFNAEQLLPFADASFDVVVISSLIEHLSSPAAFFREVHRIVCPGGRVLLIAPNDRGLISILNRWRGQPPSPWNRFRFADIQRMLVSAGFMLQEYQPCPYRVPGWRGAICYALEATFPLFATDFGFCCTTTSTLD
jgi:SAM-dependent methyltransferase